MSNIIQSTGIIPSDADSNVKNINNALNSTSEVYLLKGTYYISSSIIIPAYKRLLMSKETIIKPTGNFDVFLYNTYSYMEYGRVELSDIPNFTQSIIKNEKGNISTFISKGLQAYRGAGSNYSKITGNGITLDCTGSDKMVVAFSRFEDFYLQGFENCINISVPQDNSVNWANANVFAGTSSVCSRAINNINGGGNYYNIQAQSGYYEDIPCVYSKGDRNVITGVIYDAGNTGKSKIAIELDGIHNTVLMDLPSKLIVDRRHGLNITPQTRKQFAPLKGKNDTFGMVGTQDNFLIGADVRFAVSEHFINTTPLNTAFSLKNAFQAYSGRGAIYKFTNPNSKTDNVEVTIDLLENCFIPTFGTTMRYNDYANKVVLSVFSTYDNTWYDKVFSLSKGGSAVWEIGGDLHFNVYSKISKLRVTYYQPSNEHVEIGSIFATNFNGSNAFLPINGGKVHGNLEYSSNNFGSILISPNGSRYRLKVDDTGNLETTKL